MTKPKTDLTAERVRELFDYDAEAGVLIRTFKNGKRNPCGHKPVCNGYGRVSIDGTLYLVHRVIWLWHHGSWSKNDIDHKDRDPMNNRIDNLRPATKAENQHNQSIHQNNSSGYTGVYFHKATNKYMAYICVNGKLIYLGLFTTSEDAFLAYQLAKIEHHPTSPAAQEYYRELTIAG